MKKPLMTIGLREITEEDMEHFFHKWLYQYGGASDVVTLQQYVEDYNRDELKEELSDVMCMIELMIEYGIISKKDLSNGSQLKKMKLMKWSNLI